jgi:cytoskeletal protein RodZ
MAGDRAKIKVRFFEVEVEGTDKSVQEALASVSGALARPVIVQRSAVSAERPSALSQSVPTAQPQFEYELEEPEPVPSVTPKAPRKQSVPDYQVKEIELKEGPVSWEAFAKAKNPSSDLMKHLVAAYWLKKYRGQASVDPNDAYTLYKAVKWPPSKNMGQQFSDLTRKRDLMKSTGRGQFAINHLGEAEVEKMGSSVDEA